MWVCGNVYERQIMCGVVMSDGERQLGRQGDGRCGATPGDGRHVAGDKIKVAVAMAVPATCVKHWNGVQAARRRVSLDRPPAFLL